MSRRLEDAELARLQATAPVSSIDSANAPEYALRLRPEGDFDAAVAAVLRAVLDLGVVPRRLHEGRSLERHFLEVTGGEQNGATAGGA